MSGQRMHTYVVVGKKQETARTATLDLRLQDGSIPLYRAGQYITVYFPDSSTQAGKAYSISSAPCESACTITVRAVGEFSHRLCALVPGDTLLASLPRGFFYPAQNGTGLFMIAGGIGITPFRSLIMDIAGASSSRSMHLLHSVRVRSDILFADAFDSAMRTGTQLRVERYVTREDPAPADRAGRIRIIDALRAIQPSAATEYLICGTLPLVRDMRRDLLSSGVSAERIATETIF